MKKRYSYLILLLIFFGFTAFVVIKYSIKQPANAADFRLKERQGPTALLPEWADTKMRAEKLHQNLAVNPEDVKSKIALSALYMQEARITGDHTYYDAAALKLIDELLAKNAQQFEALVLKATLQLSAHHFSDALETAAVAQKQNPYNAFIYGIMVDGNVEMGYYDKAVECSDKMMSIRPDIRSYSRVSYLREIHGDPQGAIEAMKMAVDAGGYGDEGSAWARIQLARLYEAVGDLKAAEMHYMITLEQRPRFGYALAGLGNIAMANKNYPAAIAYYQQADSCITDYGIKEQLASLYSLNGEPELATKTTNAVIAQLTKASARGETGINHHADKELAYVYLMNGNNEKALAHALAEYNRRPANIEVNEAVAWAYFHTGDYPTAMKHMEKALRTNCKNPTLLCRAAIVTYYYGDKQKAKQLLQQALQPDPNIDPLLKEKSKTLLSQLN